MYNHATSNYVCPLCLANNGIENDKTMMKQKDIVYKDTIVTAAINSKFMGNNPGHVIVFPVDHYENLYETPKEVLSRIVELSQKIAIAMKELRKCDGVMIQQNNEPASGQHAFHYHMHVIPRFKDDNYYTNASKVWVATEEERLMFSEPLRVFLKNRT